MTMTRALHGLALFLGVQLVASSCVKNATVCLDTSNDCCAPYASPLEEMKCAEGYTAVATGKTCIIFPGAEFTCCPSSEVGAGECLGSDIKIIDQAYNTGECSASNCEGVKNEWCGPCKSVEQIRMSTDHGGWTSRIDSWCEDNPCFDREVTTACKLSDPTASPSAAYAACYEGGTAGPAARAFLSDLRAGDIVLSTPTEVTRVIVNQHVVSGLSSQMVRLIHASGTLSLTPDHVLLVDGMFKPAREAAVGSVLSSGSIIEQVSSSSTSGIINPITTSGRILVGGTEGAPVTASVYGEWIASFMLDKSTLSLSRVIAYFWPATTQQFYDHVLEQFFDASTDGLKVAAKTLPSPLVGLTMLGLDLLIAAGFSCYALTNVEILFALATAITLYRALSTVRK